MPDESLNRAALVAVAGYVCLVLGVLWSDGVVFGYGAGLCVAAFEIRRGPFVLLCSGLWKKLRQPTL